MHLLPKVDISRCLAISVFICASGHLQASSGNSGNFHSDDDVSVAQASVVRGNFNGIWSGEQGVLWDPTVSGGASTGQSRRQDPPFTPEFEKLYQEALDAAAAGRPFVDPPTMCLPPGTPRIMASPFPIEMVVTPDVVYMLFEYMSQTRRIFMSESAPGSIGEPTYNGYSVGRWEGNDLIVDTIDLLADTVLDTTHVSHSELLNVHERFRLLSPEKMEVTITLIDPKAYVHPWVVTRTYVKRPGDRILEYVCEENNRNPVLEDGTTGFVGANER